MSNLIPEKRLDKNGVLTTKHVRAAGKPVVSRRQAPAPSIGGSFRKAPKLTPKQKEQRYRNFHFQPVADADKRLLAGRAPHDPIFTASDAEIYDVLSVTNPGNATLLLEKGVRNADEAVAYLEKLGAEDLLRDHSGLMNEMISRRVSPEDTVNGMLYLDVHMALRPGQEDHSANYPDTIEFLSMTAFERTRGRAKIKDDILAGRINVEDIKSIGVTRLKPYDRLHFVREMLVRKQSGERDFDIEEMKAFLDKSTKSGLSQGHFKEVIHLFDELGGEGVEKLNDLKSYTGLLWTEEKRYEDEEIGSLVRRTLFFAQLSERLQNGPIQRSGRYWASEFKEDAMLIYQSGVNIEDAIRLMNDGYDARKVAGIVNGMEPAVSDGWL